MFSCTATGCGLCGQHVSDIRPIAAVAILFREIAFCIASDFGYSYPFSRGVVCRLSVVCHIRASCLNRSTDLHGIRQVDLRDPMTNCVRRSPWIPGEGEILRVEPLQPKPALAYSWFTISDIASYHITSGQRVPICATKHRMRQNQGDTFDGATALPNPSWLTAALFCDMRWFVGHVGLNALSLIMSSSVPRFLDSVHTCTAEGPWRRVRRSVPVERAGRVAAMSSCQRVTGNHSASREGACDARRMIADWVKSAWVRWLTNVIRWQPPCPTIHAPRDTSLEF